MKKSLNLLGLAAFAGVLTGLVSLGCAPASTPAPAPTKPSETPAAETAKPAGNEGVDADRPQPG